VGVDAFLQYYPVNNREHIGQVNARGELPSFFSRLLTLISTRVCEIWGSCVNADA
jgi:hypothetical protein